MPSIAGQLVTETLAYDGGRQVTAYVPPARPEAIVFAGDGQLIASWGGVLDPSPIVVLNRAIAVGEIDGPAVALTIVDRLDDTLAGYHAWHATRADLLRRLGRNQEARAAYDNAIALAGNTAETAYPTRRRDQMGTT